VTISLGHGLLQYDQRTEAAKEAGWRQMTNGKVQLLCT